MQALIGVSFAPVPHGLGSSLKLFAVFKQGVYRQGCGGIFSTFDLALEAAKRLCAGERDDYHTYEVVPLVLDVMTTQTARSIRMGVASGRAWIDGGELEEATPLAYVGRSARKLGGGAPSAEYVVVQPAEMPA